MRAPLVGGSGGVYALCSAHLANVVMVRMGEAAAVLWKWMVAGFADPRQRFDGKSEERR